MAPKKNCFQKKFPSFDSLYLVKTPKKVYFVYLIFLNIVDKFIIFIIIIKLTRY